MYPISVIDYNGPKGIAYACIEGLRHVSGDIILCTDGDSYVPHNWCAVMKKTLRNNNVLVGSWIKYKNTFFGRISNIFNMYKCISKHHAERWVWGPSMAFWKRDSDVVREIFEQSILLSQELGLSRNPDDYWLALFMKKRGQLQVTNKTYVAQHPKEQSSIEMIQRNKENMNNARLVNTYIERFFKMKS